MKKWMIGCFWALLVFPNLLWPAAAPFLTEDNAENTENRVLAQFPELNMETFQEFPIQMEAYINDHAAFRNQFLSLNAGINLGLFQSIDNVNVIRGQDGWYFYNGGMSIPDYRGQDLYSQEELEEIAVCIERARMYYESLGTEFAVVLAPNKEEIYSEYMPKWITRLSDITRYDQVEQCLKGATGAIVVAPKSYFLEHKEDRLWYFKTDTHWNEAGGFVAGQMLIDKLGGQAVSTDDVTITYDYRGPGDLALLFYMPDYFLEDYFCTVHGYYDDMNIEYTDLDGIGQVVHTRTEGAPDDRRVAFYRDSFASVMQDKMSRYFKNVDYYHWQSFQREYLEENPPDVLVYELVEREFIRIRSDIEKMVPEDWMP